MPVLFASQALPFDVFNKKRDAIRKKKKRKKRKNKAEVKWISWFEIPIEGLKSFGFRDVNSLSGDLSLIKRPYQVVISTPKTSSQQLDLLDYLQWRPRWSKTKKKETKYSIEPQTRSPTPKQFEHNRTLFGQHLTLFGQHLNIFFLFFCLPSLIIVFFLISKQKTRLDHKVLGRCSKGRDITEGSCQWLRLPCWVSFGSKETLRTGVGSVCVLYLFIYCFFLFVIKD